MAEFPPPGLVTVDDLEIPDLDRVLETAQIKGEIARNFKKFCRAHGASSIAELGEDFNVFRDLVKDAKLNTFEARRLARKLHMETGNAWTEDDIKEIMITRESEQDKAPGTVSAPVAASSPSAITPPPQSPPPQPTRAFTEPPCRAFTEPCYVPAPGHAPGVIGRAPTMSSDYKMPVLVPPPGYDQLEALRTNDGYDPPYTGPYWGGCGFQPLAAAYPPQALPWGSWPLQSTPLKDYERGAPNILAPGSALAAANTSTSTQDTRATTIGTVPSATSAEGAGNGDEASDFEKETFQRIFLPTSGIVRILWTVDPKKFRTADTHVMSSQQFAVAWPNVGVLNFKIKLEAVPGPDSKDAKEGQAKKGGFRKAKFATAWLRHMTQKDFTEHEKPMLKARIQVSSDSPEALAKELPQEGELLTIDIASKSVIRLGNKEWDLKEWTEDKAKPPPPLTVCLDILGENVPQ